MLKDKVQNKVEYLEFKQTIMCKNNNINKHHP